MDHLRKVIQSHQGPIEVDRLEEIRGSPPAIEAVKESTIFWDQYVQETEQYDTEMVKGMRGDLDSILIFAGLFSVVNTIFIVNAYQKLLPDLTEDTNVLLREIIRRSDGATFDGLGLSRTPYLPSLRAVRVNQLFSSSLCCSLLAAFGAVLAKQWLNEYQRGDQNRSAFTRSIRRHQKFLRMQQYRFDFIIQILPLALQLSLFLFLTALVELFWALDSSVAAVIISFSGVGLLLYLITILISIWDSISPFSTRSSSYLRQFLRFRPNEVHDQLNSYRPEHSTSLPVTINSKSADDLLDVASGCVVWMKENTTSFKGICAMASIATTLPVNIRQKKHLSGEEIGPIFIASILANNAIKHGTPCYTLNSTLRVLLDVVTDWRPGTLSRKTHKLIFQLHDTLRWAVSSDHSSSELLIKILGQFVSATSVYQVPLVDMEVLREVLAIRSLDDTGKRVALVFLWAWIKKTDVEIILEWFNSDWFKAPGQLLSATQWLDATKTIHDPDEEMLRFRLLWNKYYYIRSESIAEFPLYHRNLISLSSYLACWMKAHPDDHQYQADLLLSEFLKVFEAAHGLWSLGDMYPLELSLIAKMYDEDGHIDGAIEWVVSRSDLGVVEVLCPCVWAYHRSTSDPSKTPAVIPESYFNMVLSLLESGTIIEGTGKEFIARVGVDLSDYATPTIFFSLCWLIKGRTELLKPGMVRILPILNQIGCYTRKLPSGSTTPKQDINPSLAEVARLFGDEATSFLEKLDQEPEPEVDDLTLLLGAVADV